jgi:hypothetical protein
VVGERQEFYQHPVAQRPGMAMGIIITTDERSGFEEEIAPPPSQHVPFKSPLPSSSA